MPTLLLELFSEEIPARMQAQAARDLERLVTEKLREENLSFDAARAHVTPRRLTLVVEGLPARQPDSREERKGPRADAPEKAIEGFLRSSGLTRDQVEERDTPKGKVLFAVIEKKGAPTADVIAAIVPTVIRAFPWPKSMRWGTGTLRWVRPLHSILCLLDGAVVPFSVDGIESGGTTRGHRFHAPDAITVKGFDDYQKSLRAAKVVLDREERKNLILDAARKAAQVEGYELVEDAGLLEEVAGLVEWPVVKMGRFDDAFLDLPDEVLTAVMRGHQKYFSVRDPKSGRLAPRFVVVANIEAADGGAAMLAGYERVLAARLNDARFFWDEDRKIKLADRLPKLEDITFHAKLGTVGQKVARVKEVAASLAFLIDADVEKTKLAAHLAKADLVTGMVGEFPELQGHIGRYYALEEGIDAEIADAIRDHYSPLGPSDQCPTQPVSIAVALADKLDTLIAFWAIDEKPTGSKDPYALRRAALGIIRLILENELRVSMAKCFAVYNIEVGNFKLAEKDNLFPFFADRLKVYLRDRGARHDLVDAVFAFEDQDDLLMIVRRVEALGSFLSTDDGANLLSAYRRAGNVLRIEQKKDGVTYDATPDENLFAEKEEKALFAALVKTEKATATALEKEDFEAAMRALSHLRAPVDAFFDKVTVNADDKDLRANRLKLLARIIAAMNRIAIFSKVEGA